MYGTGVSDGVGGIVHVGICDGAGGGDVGDDGVGVGTGVVGGGCGRLTLNY